MAPIDRTRNLVLSEPVNLGAPAQRGLAGVTASPQNPVLQPNNAQLRGIFGSLSESVRTIEDLPGLTHTAPTRAAGDPPGTAQAGTVVFDRARSFQTGDGTGVRLSAGAQGSYLSDEQLRRNLDLGGGTTAGVGELNLRGALAVGTGSLETIGQPGNLQPSAGIQFSGQIDNVGNNPVYRGEVRATVAGTQAALSAFGRVGTDGQRAVGVQGIVRPFQGTTLNLDVTATDGPRAGDARLTGRAGVAVDLGNGFSANGYVQREIGGARDLNSAGVRLQYQFRF